MRVWVNSGQIPLGGSRVSYFPEALERIFIRPDNNNSRVKVPSPMAFRKIHTAALAAALLLGGCSFVDDSLFPSLSSDDSTDGGNATAVAAPTQVSSKPLSDDRTNYMPPAVSDASSTGTSVGVKVSSLRGDLTQLQNTLSQQNQQMLAIRNQTVQDSQRFHGTVAAMQARLQIGTTPGNPVLVKQWNDAQGELDRINEDVLNMNRLTGEVASTSSLAGYLLQSVRAARTLSGAVDEDHRQLRVLEDETAATTVLIERLLTELSADSQRQQQYLNNEHSDLNTLAVAVKNGQLYGSSLSGSRFGTSLMAPNSYPMLQPTSAPVAAPLAAQPTSFGQAANGPERPLVVIRFDRPNVNYEDALYTAVKGAMDRRPNAVFEVVATNSNSMGESQSLRNAQSVARSLTQLGLPNERIRMSQSSAATASNGEVQVFAR